MVVSLFLGGFWGSWVDFWRSSTRLCYMMRYLVSIFCVLWLLWVDLFYFSMSKIIDFPREGRQF